VNAKYPELAHIPLADLIAAAGDPWQLDATLQSGDPGQIAELANAFRDAGDCANETWAEFDRARQRFYASWNRQTGQHPINDGIEVRHATTSLFVSREHLPKIAIDLENIAADLAESQRMSAFAIDQLNGQLHALDIQAGQALADNRDTSAIAKQAVDDTAATHGAIEMFQHSYADKLQAALTDLRLNHGYDPAAIEDADGDAEPGPEQRAEAGTQAYGAAQRAQDEALVNDGGPITPEKAAAAARLQDYATATDPSATAESRRLAGERLDDFRMANFNGPLPADPILGGDARTRAHMRLDMQRQLEQGFRGLPPMSRDQATQALDDGEQFGRSVAVKQAYFALTSAGMSGDGAKKTISDLISGKQVVSNIGLAAQGAEKGLNKVPEGVHAKVSGLSAADAKALENIAGKVSKVGDAFTLANAARDLYNGGSYENACAAAGGVVASNAAAWGTAIVAGSFTGPWTTAALVIGAAFFAGKGGEALGGMACKPLDK